MEAVSPKDGLYVSETGYPIYVVACREVRDALTVIKAVGAKAEKMLEALGDPDTVLQRLGLAY
jgi:predicted flap endonuclease-1-like 5' DNA nuclease